MTGINFNNSMNKIDVIKQKYARRDVQKDA